MFLVPCDKHIDILGVSCFKTQSLTHSSRTQENKLPLQTRFKPKVVARRKAGPDDAAANEASTSGAPENDAFKDLIVAVSKTAPSMFVCCGVWLLWQHSKCTFAGQPKKLVALHGAHLCSSA